MVHKFEYQGEQFAYIPFCELSPDDLPEPKSYKQSNFVDIGSGFDIETTKVPNQKLSFMYIWQMSFDDVTVIGRTWDEYRKLLEMVHDRYKLNSKRKLLCYVHNLPFEFQFIKTQLEFSEYKGEPCIFAIDNRTVIKATTKTGIEFRDSLILTQLPLEKVATNFELKARKLKGDLDYDLVRTCITPLSESELAYCINDVQILSEFYHKYIKRNFIAKQLKVPLTATGIPRDEMHRMYKAIPKKERNKIKKRLQRAYPSEKLYKAMIQWLYRGGFVHANVSMAHVTHQMEDMASIDFKSSYPAIMLQCKIGWEFVERGSWWFYENWKNKKVMSEYDYFGIFDFYNIERKQNHAIESKNKIIAYSDDAIFDNGRLVSASHIRVMLTNYDIEIYDMFYSFDDEPECLTLYVATKEDLPIYLKEMVLKYFELKETLPKDTIEYINAKAQLNALYGVCVQGLNDKKYKFDINSKVFITSPLDKTYNELIKDKILLPQFGIYITSIARYRLLMNLASDKIGNDGMYCDTDSIKLLNYTGHKHVIDEYNERITRINKNMYVGTHNREIYSRLGHFDFEGKLFKFKTNGCKRYIYTTADFNKKTNKYDFVTHSTIAGLNKKALPEFCEREGVSMYDVFNESLKLNENDSKKLTTAYCDSEFTRTIKDYQGNICEVSEKSCVTLYKIHFDMKMKDDYLHMISEFETMNETRFVERNYV